MIKLLRVDYRLVHGQVAISWSRHIGADCILVANDEVAKDEMRQSMLRLSKPQGMKLVIKSIEDSVKSIKSGVTDKYKMFIQKRHRMEENRPSGCGEVGKGNTRIKLCESWCIACK